MRPLVTSVGPNAAANTASLAALQNPPAGTAFTLLPAAASFGPSQVTLTFVASEVGHTFTITGTDVGGNPVQEKIAGTAAGTVDSALTYKSIKSVVASPAQSGNVSVGTDVIGSSNWLRMDEWALPNIAVSCEVTGVVNYTVQHSFDDPNSPTSPVAPSAMVWQPCPVATLVGASTVQSGYYPFIPLWIRVLLNSGTGSVSMTVVQPSVVPE